MDHSEVTRRKLVESYILGELSPEVCEEFEEHYFECSDCAASVWALSRLRTAARWILEHENVHGVAPADKQSIADWFAWLRPAVAVPVIGFLAAVIVFQASVTIPGLRKRAAGGESAQIYTSSFHIQGSTRSESISTLIVAPNEKFGLDFDFIPSRNLERYEGRLLDPDGKPVLTFGLKGEQANKESHLVIPAGVVRAGTYALVILGEPEARNSEAGVTEVQRLSFTIELRP